MSETNNSNKDPFIPADELPRLLIANAWRPREQFISRLLKDPRYIKMSPDELAFERDILSETLQGLSKEAESN